MSIVMRMLFGLCVVVAPIVVWTTSAQLPARVASHFGAGRLCQRLDERTTATCCSCSA